MVSINFCNPDNISSLMKFIGDNWASEHILAKDFKFMKWQHYEDEKNRYNFVIAKSNSNIIGCHGFINHSRFSKKLSSNDTVWLVNWFAIKGTPNPGLDLLFFPEKNLRFNRIGTIGCNDKATKIFKKLGFEVGELKHYFTINPIINEFKLINKQKKFAKSTSENKENKKMKFLNGKLELNIFGNNTEELVKKFGKDEIFFINRYIKHLYYKYKIYWIYDSNDPVGFFVTRICEFKGKKALRIVDFFGYDKALIGINKPLEKLLIEIDAEYVDFYEYGIDDLIMSKSGLYRNNFNNQITIPNYFEPFVKKNINLRWAIKSNSSTAIPMFKGDCDQDRPNRLSK